jgi:hypothetical protein
VVRLKAGEYTRFFIPTGEHVIGISWRIGGVVIATPFGIGETPEVRKAPEFYKETKVECHPGDNYSYGIKASAFAWNEEDRVSLQKVSDADEDSRLDDKVFVPAGVRDAGQS